MNLIPWEFVQIVGKPCSFSLVEFCGMVEVDESSFLESPCCSALCSSIKLTGLLGKFMKLIEGTRESQKSGSVALSYFRTTQMGRPFLGLELG